MIITVKKKSALIAIALIFIMIALTTTLTSPSLESAVAKSKKVPIYCVKTDEKKVALTFDAAWGADKTSKIMDILDNNQAKGTFFLVGFWIDAFPEKVEEINKRGYLIGNHSANHLHMNQLDQDSIIKEIETTNDKIEKLAGYRPSHFRAPFGEYNNKLIEYTEEKRIQMIQWSIDTLDWKGLSGEKIAERVLAHVKGGDIILCHNNSDHILEALPLILIGLKNKGLSSVRMDDLVIKQNYYIDNNGMQIEIKQKG